MAESRHDETLWRAVFERALLRGSFTLRSGATSEYYFDKYRVTCDPQLLRSVADALAAKLAPDTECLVAPALGAVPLAAALALSTDLPFIIVRTDDKSYGTANQIEGVIPNEGTRGVLIEDVVTSGGAALAALAAARDAGVRVTRTLCILDRDGGGREALAAADAQLTSLFSAADMAAAISAHIGAPA